MKTGIALVGGLLIIVLGLLSINTNKPSDSDNDAQMDIDVAQATVLFEQKCGVCHRLNDTSFIGPSLNNVVMRRAGTYPSYNYSEALGQSDLIWTQDNLRQYLANPNEFVSGTSMMLEPLPEEEINNIVEFLALQKNSE